MATDKRDRQRANREMKLAEEMKVHRRERVLGTTKRVVIWVVAFALLVWVTSLIFGGGPDTNGLAGIVLT